MTLHGLKEELVTTHSEKFGEIAWTKTTIERLDFSYKQHLMMLQGLTLSEVFVPHLLLQAVPAACWRVPYSLSDVVLATVHQMETDQAPLREVTLELMATIRG